MIVKLSLEYQGHRMVLPTNPEHIQINYASPGFKSEVVGMGEITLPTTTRLATLTIQSFFWYQVLQDSEDGEYTYRRATEYVEWIRAWQLAETPARWVVEAEGDLQNTFKPMWVWIDSFDYDVRAGEEEDVYYTMSLSEYRPYGARFIKRVEPIVWQPNMPPQKTTAQPTASGEARTTTTKPPAQTTHTVRAGDTVLTITRAYTGNEDRWRDLYNANVNTLMNVARGTNITLVRLAAGLVLTLPKGWWEHHLYLTGRLSWQEGALK